MSDHNKYLRFVKRGIVRFNGQILAFPGGWQNLVESANPKVSPLFRSISTGKFQTSTTVLVLHDEWSEGYFHWLMDVLPKFYLLRNELVTWTVVFPRKLNSFQRDSLQAFSFRNTIYLERWEVLIAMRVACMQFPWKSGCYDEKLYRELADWLVAKALGYVENGELIGFKEIFASRQSAAYRRVANMHELYPLLETHSIAVLESSDLGFWEQVVVFSNCRLLIGCHGAALANMLFMPAGSIIIELRNSFPEGNNCYQRLAAVKGHEYYSLVPDTNNPENFQTDDIVVPVEGLKDLLTALSHKK